MYHQASSTHRWQRNALLSLVLYMLALLALTAVLPSCTKDDSAAPSPATAADDHGGHGGDDPPGDDNGGGN
ncbi:MAG: hypothetical protein QY325_07115 [Flavobacteriales bacterium]|jgi:hypothetical protein|nr:MAG: hypothetical protein QY325_07115 [Flavobacteriales bacterium]